MNSNPLPSRALQHVWRLYRYAVIVSVLIVRREGWRELLRQRGWRFFAAIVAYYLVRDILLYIVLPLWLAREVWAG